MRFHQTNDRKLLLALILIMIATVIAAPSLFAWRLYSTAINERLMSLSRQVHRQALLISVLAQIDTEFSQSGKSHGALEVILRQVEAANADFGESGEFIVAKSEGDRIVLLSPLRFADIGNNKSLSFQSELAVAIHNALMGLTGTIIGPDHSTRLFS